MTPVDRAFAIEKSKALAKRDALRERAKRELPMLEEELSEIREQAKKLWIAICEAEGITPEQLKRGERLITSDENYELAEKCDIVNKLFTRKLARYRVYCDLLNIKPNLKERGSPDERSTSNSGASVGPASSPGLRQPRRDNSRRVPRRRAPGNNRRR